MPTPRNLDGPRCGLLRKNALFGSSFPRARAKRGRLLAPPAAAAFGLGGQRFRHWNLRIFLSFCRAPDRQRFRRGTTFSNHAEDAETRSRAFADPPSALPGLPNADDNGRRLLRPRGLRASHIRMFAVWPQRNQGHDQRSPSARRHGLDQRRAAASFTGRASRFRRRTANGYPPATQVAASPWLEKSKTRGPSSIWKPRR